MLAPTLSELWDCDQEKLQLIFSDTVDKWRWGTIERDIYRRLSDDTYWSIYYRMSSDGETNEFRDGETEVTQVYPTTKVIIEYVEKQPVRG